MDYTLKEGQAIRGVKTEWNDDKGQFNRKDSYVYSYDEIQFRVNKTPPKHHNDILSNQNVRFESTVEIRFLMT